MSTSARHASSEPLPWEALVDYWVGELPSEEAAAVEEHFFACVSCEERLASLAMLIGGIREVLHGAGEELVVRQEALDALIAQGKRISEWHLSPGGRHSGAIPPDVDFVVGRLAADLSGLNALDVELCGPDGKPFYTIRDAQFDPLAGEVLVLCHRHVAESQPEIVVRLVGVTGSERKTSEYVLVNVTS